MPPRTSSRKKAAAAVPDVQENIVKADKTATTKKTTTASSKKRKATDQDDDHKCDSHDEKYDDDDDEEEEDDDHNDKKAPTKKPKPAPKKRKTKQEKEAEQDMQPLAARTAVGSLKKAMYIGAHVSAAGGVQNALTNATHIGANALALFLKSQRKWTSPPLEPATTTAFRTAATAQAYNQAQHVLPHGSYLVNLAQADAAKADQAYTNFIDDLHRCDALGIGLYNFHPGSTGGAPMADATARIAAQLNRAHRETQSVVTVVENMCGHGNIIGGRFEDLAAIIAGVDDKSRVAVCLDTCHAFAAGYDLRTPAAFADTMAEFDRVVGLQYLRALHVNDSKAPFASHRDLHANIGTGFLGLRAFHCVVNYDGFAGLPLVLETPIERKNEAGKTVEDKSVWADEIKLLEWLIDADVESDEFKAKEKALQDEGASERKRVQAQVDAKAAKDAKKGGAKKGKGKKKGSDEDDDDE